MIGFTDVAIVAYFKNTVFSSDPSGRNPVVAWGPPEVSRQSAAIAEGQSDTGIPSVTIFRTACNLDTSRVNMPRIAGVGLPNSPSAISGRRRPITPPSPLPTQESRILDYPCVVEYTLSCWSSALSDLNDIERELAFCTRWHALEAVNIPTAAGVVSGSFRWFMSIGAPAYKQDIQKDSGKVIFYGLEQKILVASSWIHVINKPLVLSIDLNFYNGVVSGDDIPDNLLDQITVTTSTTPPASENVPGEFGE